jgi:hypothetical protein
LSNRFAVRSLNEIPRFSTMERQPGVARLSRSGLA